MTITKEELEKILEEHRLWLQDEGGKRADLSGIDLSGANLYGVNLCGATLRGADLHGANLIGANLFKTNLCKANLYGASLCGANLYGADLYGADFSQANLYEANLYEVTLSKVKNISFIPMACPDTGSFVAWKKANRYIIKLQIPEDAKRLSATGRKCRADKAIVLAIENFDGTPAGLKEVESNYDSNFIYKIGETVSVHDFCENRFDECAPGIHFFINREEAVQYSFY